MTLSRVFRAREGHDQAAAGRQLDDQAAAGRGRRGLQLAAAAVLLLVVIAIGVFLSWFAALVVYSAIDSPPAAR